MTKLEHVGLESDQTKGYAHMYHCLNCGNFATIYIPYRTTIKGYLKDKCCERCKCEGVLY